MYTMCPPGCHHNGFMATPELGHRMYGYTLLDCIVESQECSNCKQLYIYITNCRQYCFGLLGFISAVLMSRMEVKQTLCNAKELYIYI